MPTALPEILSLDLYNLDGDPVHRDRFDGEPAATLPGASHRFQHAQELPSYIWPQNAGALGYQRHTIKPDDERLTTRKTLAVIKCQRSSRLDDDGLAEHDYPAFLYTSVPSYPLGQAHSLSRHPRLKCDQCVKLGTRWLQWVWEEPNPETGHWPNVYTGSIVALECWRCRIVGQPVQCSNRGADILNRTSSEGLFS